jgi:uncharacterized protein involved in outer membrane biogenesis
MKKLFKWLFRLLIVLVILVLVLVLFIDRIAKSLAERQIHEQTGMEVKIGKLTIGLKSPTVTVLNFKLINPPEFGGSPFLDVPELRMNYDLSGLLSRKIHLNLLRFNLAELHIVQNKDGKTNVRAVQERQKQKESKSETTESKTEFQGIDTLTLNIGRIKYTSLKTPANNQEVWAGVKNETVKSVKSGKDLMPLITRISLQKSAPFLIDSFLDKGTNSVQNATQSVEKEAQKALDGLTNQLKKP